MAAGYIAIRCSMDLHRSLDALFANNVVRTIEERFGGNVTFLQTAGSWSCTIEKGGSRFRSGAQVSRDRLGRFSGGDDPSGSDVGTVRHQRGEHLDGKPERAGIGDLATRCIGTFVGSGMRLLA